MFKKMPGMAVALVSALAAATVNAETGPTREQVRAETLATMRNGDMVAASGQSVRTVTPGLYPALPTTAGETRSEVKAELAEAARKGELMATGEADLLMREEFPQRYEAQ